MSIISSLANNFTAAGKLKAAGFNNASLANVTALDSSVALGNLILLSTQTASASANISFTTGINSTYDEYVFKFINMHPSTNGARFEFNMSTDGGSNYNVTKTTTIFESWQGESGDPSDYSFAYQLFSDLAQSTDYQKLANEVGNENDESASGELILFAPSSTTFVKHFMAKFHFYDANPRASTLYTAGYGNTTSAINAINFKFSSGNIDDGIIKMYGVKKS